MSSIYKNGKYYYLSVNVRGKRKIKSLGTTSYKKAQHLKPQIESDLLFELLGKKSACQDLTFEELKDKFLRADHNWSKSTYNLNQYILNSYITEFKLPENITSQAIYRRHINQCWKWGLKHNLVKKAKLLKGDIKGESRLRTFTKDELCLLFDNIIDKPFNMFVRFAYYTGARSGEIRTLTRDQVLEDSLVVRGKTGQRIIKLNNQAKEVIKNHKELWNYTKDYVSHKFKKEVRKVGISNARFHDLRRTFGLNLIKQGMSIYKVSKLLGHKSVRTTEQHYAPLLTVEIEDFIL